VCDVREGRNIDMSDEGCCGLWADAGQGSEYEIDGLVFEQGFDAPCNLPASLRKL
jgi:hypothetical protein